MRAFAKLAAGFAILASASAAAGAEDPDYDVAPSATPAIVAAVQECRAATARDRVDQARLIAGGWARFEAQGRPADVRGLDEFRRGGTIVWLPRSGSSCIVLARLQDRAQYDGVVAALGGVYGPRTQHRANDGALWLEDSGAGFQVDRSGDRERPAVRIFILPATHDEAGGNPVAPNVQKR